MSGEYKRMVTSMKKLSFLKPEAHLGRFVLLIAAWSMGYLLILGVFRSGWADMNITYRGLDRDDLTGIICVILFLKDGLAITSLV